MRDFSSAAWAASALYVAAWIPIAWFSGTLFPGQMMAKYSADKVIPLVVDCYFWADLLLFPPLLGYVAPIVEKQWSQSQIILMLALGLVQAVLFQRFVIAPGKFPCSLGGAGVAITPVAVAHAPFFACVAAYLELFLFTAVPVESVVVVAAGLMLIAPIDILAPLPLIKHFTEYTWIPDVFGEEPRVARMIAGVEAFVVVCAALKIAI